MGLPAHWTKQMKGIHKLEQKQKNKFTKTNTEKDHNIKRT